MAIGASAGGLEAFTRLLKSLSADTGMAFVFIQHLDVRHASHLPELLGRATAMRAVEAAHQQRLEPNTVYVIPPNVQMTIAERVLQLAPLDRTGLPPRAIDQFCESLAHDQGPLAIGVVLSGTGSDGTLGLKAIKAEGGVTFVQDEPSAEFKGMPHSAISAGAADFVLPPDAIAAKLAELRDHALVHSAKQPAAEPSPTPTVNADALGRIVALLRTETGVDFAAYKKTTLGRRVLRRMVLNGIESLPDYAEHLKDHPDEVVGLHDDIFIHVTGFFRDADVYQALAEKVLPGLAKRDPLGPPVRIWVPGCSTGEEVYSLAIAWIEATESLGQHVTAQLFGTDISLNAINAARAGNYPEAVTASVPADRLQRYFVRTGGTRQITKRVRDLCVFAPHNLLNDPPFTQLDLLCCRNVLIYLEPEHQQKLLQLYHHALRPNGSLVLGLSEDIGRLNDLFAVIDKKHRIYAKKAAIQPPLHELIPLHTRWGRAPADQTAASAHLVDTVTAQEVWQAADRAALAKYAPPGVIVDENLEIVQFRGRVGAFLEPAPGQPTRHLPKMARDGLQLALGGLVRQAQRTNTAARQDGLQVKTNGGLRAVSVEVTPFQVSPRTKERYFLVTFEEPAARPQPAEAPASRPARDRPGSAARRSAQLEQELIETRATLQTVAEERDANTEELVAALEELQSGNEELQATNEELQSAKEELQSANEELTTLNEELDNRNQELSLALGNLTNVLDSVRIPIVIVGGNLRIRLYNPAAERVMNLVATDVGRPIGEIKTRLTMAELEPTIRLVMQTLEPHDEEVQDRDGRWYAMRIRPYQNIDNRLDGAVLTWSDISALRASLRTATQARDHLDTIVAAIREPLLVLDAELIIELANQAFYEMFRLVPDEVQGRLVYDLGRGEWDIPELRRLLGEILPESNHFQGVEVERDFPQLGRRSFLLNARRIQPLGVTKELILLAVEDVTAIRKLTELDTLRDLSGRMEAAREDERANLARELHDELGSALTGLKMQLIQLRNALPDDQATLETSVNEMANLIDTQIGYIRQTANRLRPNVLEQFGLDAAIEWQLAEFQKQTGIRVRLHNAAGATTLTPAAQAAAYRILQEALTNVARHSHAGVVEVTVEVRDENLHLAVRDNGGGLPPGAIKKTGSQGLAGMRERARLAGGNLEIESARGKGTTVHLTLPLGPREAKAP